MPSTPLDPSRHHAGLILRVFRPDGHSEEFYLAGGLTIGRSMANTVVLADDESVDRTHARVEVTDEGCARLRCIDPGSSLAVGDLAVREVPLDDGIRFQIGRAMFECLSGRRGSELDDRQSWSCCPYCGSVSVPAGGREIGPCHDCGSLVLPVTPDSRSPHMVIVPAILGGFRVERYVDRGGMGLVFRGWREVDGGPVAIKVLLPGRIFDRRDAERFRREMAMLARVCHPNVVKLLARGRSGGFDYLVMEWIEGPNLRSVITDANHAGRLTGFDVAIQWFRQVSMGLSAIDEAGMVHRDIKPSNILIGPDGLAKVADLGIARQVDAPPTACTTLGQTPGTFEYMAPEEHLTPDSVDRRADLYALGVTFYELLTGSRPVGVWRPASLVNPTVPRWFDSILGRLMAPVPGERFDDAVELLLAIHDHQRQPLPSGSRRSSIDDLGSDVSNVEEGIGLLSGEGRVDRSAVAGTPARPRGRLSAIESGANIGARNGAIFGICILVPCGWFVATFFQAASSSPGALDWISLTMSGITLGGLLGIIFGGMIGAIWGLLAVVVAGPGSIKPVSFAAIRTLGRFAKRLVTFRPSRLASVTSPGGMKTGPQVSPASSSEAADLAALTSGASKGSVSTEKSPSEKTGTSTGWPGWITGVIVASVLRAYFQPTPITRPIQVPRPPSFPRSSYAERLGVPPIIELPFDAARQGRVRSSIRRSQYDEAIAECDRALALGEESKLVYSYRGLAYAGKRDFARASDDCIRSISPPSDPLRRDHTLLNTLSEGRNKTLAPKPSLARLNAAGPTIHSNRAAVNLQRDDPEAAIVECNLALAIDPNHALALAHRASARSRKGSFELADADADRAVALAPDLFEARMARGEVHFARGRFDRAIVDLDEAIRCEPAAAGPYALRGKARIEKGEPKPAMADFEAALRLDPPHSAEYRRLIDEVAASRVDPKGR